MAEIDMVMGSLTETFAEYREYLEENAGFYGSHGLSFVINAIDTYTHEYSILIIWSSHSFCCGISVAKTLILSNYFDAGRYDETFIKYEDDHRPRLKRVKDGLEIDEREYYKMERELLKESCAEYDSSRHRT